MQDYVDWVAVEQVAYDGMRMPLRGPDLEAAVTAMHGKTSIDIMAWRLRCTTRSVERARKRLGLIYE